MPTAPSTLTNDPPPVTHPSPCRIFSSTTTHRFSVCRWITKVDALPDLQPAEHPQTSAAHASQHKHPQSFCQQRAPLACGHPCQPAHAFLALHITLEQHKCPCMCPQHTPSRLLLPAWRCPVTSQGRHSQQESARTLAGWPSKASSKQTWQSAWPAATESTQTRRYRSNTASTKGPPAAPRRG